MDASGLPRHTRSLLTLAMMVALNRGEEFRMHVKAAFNNGVTRDEIKEVLLQSAIYCGCRQRIPLFIWQPSFPGDGWHEECDRRLPRIRRGNGHD